MQRLKKGKGITSMPISFTAKTKTTYRILVGNVRIFTCNKKDVFTCLPSIHLLVNNIFVFMGEPMTGILTGIPKHLNDSAPQPAPVNQSFVGSSLARKRLNGNQPITSIYSFDSPFRMRSSRHSESNVSCMFFFFP